MNINDDERITKLEHQVAMLRQEIVVLRNSLARLSDPVIEPEEFYDEAERIAGTP